MPPRWSRGNPVDLAGGETRDTIPAVIDLICGHPEVDALVYIGLGIQGNTARAYRESHVVSAGDADPELVEGMARMAGFHERQEERYAHAVVEASRQHDKPIIVASELGIADPANPGPATLRELGWPCLASPAAAVGALSAMWSHKRRHGTA